MKLIYISILVAISLTTTNEKKESLDRIKADFLDCTRSNGACEGYTFEALQVVYPQKHSEHYTDNLTFMKEVRSGEEWKELGPAYKQEILVQAQQAANDDKAVVAVYLDPQDQPLHVAIILPGELRTSGSWGLEVPVSVSLPDFRPDHAYIGKPLSYAFEKSSLLSLRIFARE